MPKNGMLIRISLAVAAAAALATIAVSAAGATSARQAGTTLNGAGSTFVGPLVQKWATVVPGKLGITLNYSLVGSGAGIAAITNRSVDFGASDAPLSSSQFSACASGGSTCLQIPWALAGTAVVYKLNGVAKTVKLSGAVLAKIYLGQIKFWNDTAIKNLNAGVALPHLAISVVHRSDGSGTTFNFTDFLSSVSTYWKAHVGKGTAVNWPTGTGAAKSSGVAAAVAATNGAIGYVDVEYAIQNHLKYAAMQNKAGKFVLPTLTSIKIASKIQPKPHADGSLSIVNPPNLGGNYVGAYPICTYTYALVARKTSKAVALKKLLSWAIQSASGKGQSYGPPLLFVAIPSGVVNFDTQQIAKIHT